MAEARGNVSSDYPMKGLCEEIKNVWCGPESEPENYVVVEFPQPCETKQVPVCRPDRYLSECLLQIQFDHE